MKNYKYKFDMEIREVPLREREEGITHTLTWRTGDKGFGRIGLMNNQLENVESVFKEIDILQDFGRNPQHSDMNELYDMMEQYVKTVKKFYKEKEGSIYNWKLKKSEVRRKYNNK